MVFLFVDKILILQFVGNTLHSETDTSILTLSSKKWGFSDQAIVNDSAIIGLDLGNTFNHLLTASTCGGFDTKYRTIAPHNNLVFGVGSKPFIGFHYATEGVAQPVLSDVAKAVTNKLKSAISLVLKSFILVLFLFKL